MIKNEVVIPPPHNADPVLPGATTTALGALAARISGGGVVALCGFPASGKSTAARYVAARANAIVLDKDAFAPRLEEAVMAELNGQPHDRDGELYRRVVSPYLYEALVTNALRTGHLYPVVLDAPFLSHIRQATAAGCSLATFWRTLTGLDTPVTTAWLDTGGSEIRRRMQARAAARDVPKLAEWTGYQASVLDSGLRAAGQRVADVVIANA